mgnify:CR=1 FL=1
MRSRVLLIQQELGTIAITARLLQTLPVADLTVEDPPIEAVIDQIYTEGAA